MDAIYRCRIVNNCDVDISETEQITPNKFFLPFF